MSDKLSSILQYGLYALLGIATVIVAVFYLNLENDTAAIFDIFLKYSYALVGITALFALVFPMIYLISNPAGAKTILIGLACVGLVLVVATSLSGNTYSPEQLEAMKIDESTSSWVGAGLYFTYITLALTVVAMLVTSLVKIFK